MTIARITEVITPMFIGALLVPLHNDIPAAIAIVAVGPIIGAIAVLRYAPETQGLTLEEIQAKFTPTKPGTGESE